MKKSPDSSRKLSRSRTVLVDDTDTRVAVLENSFVQADKAIDAHEYALGKLSEISYSLKEMIVLQNQRIEQHSNDMKALHQDVREHVAEDARLAEQTRVHIDSAIKTLADYMSKDTDRKIEVLTNHLMKQSDTHRIDMVKMESRLDTLGKQHSDNSAALDVKVESIGKGISDRVYKLEKWRWIAIGVLVAVMIGFHLVDPHVLESLFGA